MLPATAIRLSRCLPRYSVLSTRQHTFRRSLHASSRLYDAASPTKLHNILEGGVAPAVQVRTVTPAGIELHDGLTIPGACIFIDGQVFMWKVPNSLVAFGSNNAKPASPWSMPGWGKEYFELFDVVIPKPEILLLGTGSTVSHPPPSIRSYLNSIGIQLDVFDTWNACTTYNLLAEEGRRVAAALLPLSPNASR
ncbi:hypothetical protein SCHPADRAFT_880544 [Schizopora paradoxa]|uniref:NADH dehydrogenase [ubiquinone] 1 alpha subcomplex assembly factor 3 n=1 Tax=Schizopora paradoxa TaxID=27342 RepID=A0A0H2R9E2_9AGAM|nr:hypothetical protein SCHPADRAFT_880544 [Schizopora paradoxa]